MEITVYNVMTPVLSVLLLMTVKNVIRIIISMSNYVLVIVQQGFERILMVMILNAAPVQILVKNVKMQKTFVLNVFLGNMLLQEIVLFVVLVV